MLAAPLPTAAPTLASAPYGAVLAPRATTGLYDYGSSCYDVDGILSCANILTGCYGNILAATNQVDAANSCLCASGIPYLNCYFNALSTAGCYESLLGTVGRFSVWRLSETMLTAVAGRLELVYARLLLFDMREYPTDSNGANVASVSLHRPR